MHVFIKRLLVYYKLHSVSVEVPKIKCDLTHLPEGPLGYKIKFGTPGLHPSAGCSAEFQSRGEEGREGRRGGGVNLQDSVHHASVR